ncbi:hypothetical protein FQN54_008514 [Arachnomyces sp. PD_36]|nr:hypothetical protein FQN54_008514 [Arachnomyces sp. PD_36]
MSLPPEHINIKRRREEEPVETLYIQSELHQKKRRFTDFIFQRVSSATTASDDGGTGKQNDAAARSQRAVSEFSTVQPGSGCGSTSVSSPAPVRGGIGAGGAPIVRVTSPGAEFRDELARRNRDRNRNVLRASSSRGSLRGAAASASQSRSRSRARGVSPLGSGGGAGSGSSSADGLRRFHLSKPLGGGGVGVGGVQKKRKGGAGAGDEGRAILVEKMVRKVERRRKEAGGGVGKGGDGGFDVSMFDDEAALQGADATPAPARKRPVINSAEKRWKAEQGAASAASSRAKANLTEEKEKTGKSVRDDPSNWDHDSDQLAQELQQVALEMMREESQGPSAPKNQASSGHAPMAGVVYPKPQLKYQPRNPPRRAHNGAAAAQQQKKDPNAMDTDDPASGFTTDKDTAGEDSDGDYVYDTYIRRPLPQAGFSERDAAAAAAASAETILQASKSPIPINGDQLSRNIGIVVISAEDEEYWDTYAVDDDGRGGEEKDWDSEDEDSNAEDHPSHDYPDEDLASDDEEDDPTAIYRKYRYRAASDDEQDFDEYGDDEDFGYFADDVDSDGEVAGGRGMGMGWGFR